MSKTKTQTARLKDQYFKNIRSELKKELGIANDLAVPRLDKIVVNIGVGEAAQDSKRIQSAIDDLTQITGQKPIATKARRAIAQFKLREGMKIGCKVTLRGQRMYEFLDRLVNIAMPRIKDFRGISTKSFDGKGNYAMGIKEQIVFPEINYDQIDKIRGMDIIICTTAPDDTQAMALLKKFNMPFRER